MVSIKLCFLFLALVHVSVVYTDDTTVLFIGNSYTNANNLGNLIQQVFSGENQVTSGVRAVDGQTLNRHYAESESSATSPLLYQALWNTSSTPWDFAVLQEQSLTPGLLNEPLYEDQFNDFFNAVSKFKEQFTNRGTTTILFETWGRRDGYTESNPPVGDIYPTYSAMQSLISEGIGLASESFDIPVAKVGRAFNYLYLNNNALFRQLYIADGSHPSILGSYLSAAVIFNTIKGAPAAQFAKTFAGVNTSTACYLARVADLVTFNLDGMPSDETCAVAPVIKTTIITPTSKFTYKGKCGGNIGAAQTREHDYFSTGLTPAATRLKLTPENGTFFMKFFFGFHLNLEEVENSISTQVVATFNGNNKNDQLWFWQYKEGTTTKWKRFMANKVYSNSAHNWQHLPGSLDIKNVMEPSGLVTLALRTNSGSDDVAYLDELKITIKSRVPGTF